LRKKEKINKGIYNEKDKAYLCFCIFLDCKVKEMPSKTDILGVKTAKTNFFAKKLKKNALKCF